MHCRAPRAASPADKGAFRDVCFLTPQSIEGPYYLDPRLVRAEIAEDRPGVPLRVDLRVIEGDTCEPSAGARVDIWHADAQGIYSGYEGQGDKQTLSTVGQKFLRLLRRVDGSRGRSLGRCPGGSAGTRGRGAGAAGRRARAASDTRLQHQMSPRQRARCQSWYV
jgi:hypothetical protein